MPVLARAVRAVFLLALFSCASPSPPAPRLGEGVATAAPSAGNRPHSLPEVLTDFRKRPKRHDSSPWDKNGAKVDLTNAVVQNASDADDRLILAIGDTCKIDVPPSGPGDATHEYQDVDCPPDYDDEAWDDCAFIITRVGARCYCLPSGDEPLPPPKPTACPKLERKSY
jgi:hypothetical protein